MYNIQEEKITVELRDALSKLVKDHHKEVGSHLPMNIDWGRYSHLQELGILFALTVRKGNELIGYCTYIISEHMRYRVPMAVADVYFIKEDERGLAGIKMLKEAEKRLKQKNVKAIINHCKIKKDMTKLFERLGYTSLEKTFIKYV